MRVTSLMMVNNMKYNVNKNMSLLEQLQYRTAEGKKFRYPSDDPIGVSRSLKYNTDISKSLQHLANVEDTVSWMTTTEAALNELKEITHRAHELTVQAANGTNIEELDKIKAEIDELKRNMIQLGNTAYAGRRLFSGFQTDTDLLDKDGKYNIELDGEGLAGLKLEDGGKEVFLYNTGVAEDVEVNTLGSQVFGILKDKEIKVDGGKTEIDNLRPGEKYVIEDAGKFYAVKKDGTFDTANPQATEEEALKLSERLEGTKITGLKNDDVIKYKEPVYENITVKKGEKPYLIKLFEKISTDLGNKDQAELRHDMEIMKDAFNNTLSVNAEFGARVNRMKLTKTKLEDSVFNLKSLMSDNENVDLAEAFTELLTSENVYRASLGVTGRIIQPTLMDFLR